MGLFDQVLGAINDPNRQASQSQVGQLVDVVGQLSQQSNTSPDTMNQAVSILGGFVRSSLQEKRNQQGEDAARSLVMEGSRSGNGVLSQLFNLGQQQALTQAISQRTGLNSGQVQALLPVLLPIVMRLLQSGESTQSGVPSNGNNTVLSAFLDADRDGDVDMGDLLSHARQLHR